MTADGSSVEARINAREQDDKVFRDEIREDLVVRREKLLFGRFPRSG